jgi:hypothetical protein
MRNGYRWVDAIGTPISPRHRSIDTAARWLSRQAVRPRTRPAPAVLLGEGPPTRVTRRVRRRPLSALERDHLVLSLTMLEMGGARYPLSVRRWRAAQARASADRRRRQASLGRITGRLTAMRGGR